MSKHNSSKQETHTWSPYCTYNACDR